MLPQRLFITGTDTGVGKTSVTCWLLRCLRGGNPPRRALARKPVVSGAVGTPPERRWEDTDRIRAALGQGVPAAEISRWRLVPPLAPPVAARQQGVALPTLAEIRAELDRPAEADVLLVEGVGGLLCPLTEQETIAELAVAWGQPLLVVARAGLGTLNHTLLTLEAAHRRGLKVKGVILNESEPAGPDDSSRETNAAELRRWTPVPVWGPFPHSPTPDLPPADFAAIDWFGRLFGP